MICLACGTDNKYGSQSCQSCSKAFAVFPPYLRSNHVCQFQAAIRDFIEGRLDFEDLGQHYSRFAELTMDFQDKWRLLEGLPLAERLSGPERETFLAGVSEIDRALSFLDEALSCADLAMESGESDQLVAVDELLTDFFKVSCSGCALLMDDLERLSTSGGSGSFLNVRED